MPFAAYSKEKKRGEDGMGRNGMSLIMWQKCQHTLGAGMSPISHVILIPGKDFVVYICKTGVIESIHWLCLKSIRLIRHSRGCLSGSPLYPSYIGLHTI